MGIQINHAGASAMSSRIGMQPVSASRFPSKAGGEIPRGLSKEEITSSMKECMEKHHVRQMTNTALQKVNAHSFLVKYDGKEEELPFDYGFVCLGMRANAPIWNDIQEAFTGEDVEVLNIGDSVRARRIIDGTDAGRHMVLNTLERLNYL